MSVTLSTNRKRPLVQVETVKTIAEEEEEQDEGDEGDEGEEGDEEAEQSLEDQEEQDEPQQKKKPKSQTSSSSSGKPRKRQPAFNAATDEVCKAVRSYFENYGPVTAVTRAAVIPAEDGGEGDTVAVGKMLHSLRQRSRSQNPSALTQSRLDALRDIQEMQNFLDKIVIRKKQNNSTTAQQITKIKQMTDEATRQALLVEQNLAHCLADISDQEVRIFELQNKSK